MLLLIKLIPLADMLVLSADCVTHFNIHALFQTCSNTLDYVAQCVVTFHYVLPTSRFFSS